MGAPCAAFRFHREWGGETNPIQLSPGTYRITVSTRIDGIRRKKRVTFDIHNLCDFLPTVVVNFP